MYQDYLTYTTTASSLTGERNDETFTRRLSARPQYTHVVSKEYRIFEKEPRIKAGYDATFYISGYNFDTDSFSVYISASPGVYTTHLSAVSAFDLFASQRNLSSIYTPFSGFELAEDWPMAARGYDNYEGITYQEPDAINHCYYRVSDNTLQVNISAAQGPGKMDIIACNAAGCASLLVDTSAAYPGDTNDGIITVEPETLPPATTYIDKDLKLYWHNDNVGATTFGVISYEMQIFEVDNNIDRNWKRTVLDHHGGLTLGDVSNESGILFLDTILQLERDSASSAYYVLSFFNLVASEPGENDHQISEGADIDAFLYNQDTNALTNSDFPLGIDFPDARYASLIQHTSGGWPPGGTLLEFQATGNSNPIWMWFEISCSVP